VSEPRDNGFEVTDLVELRPEEGAHTQYTHVTYEWARQWPCEEVWKARLAGVGAADAATSR
jgi:hypothetical protein